MSRPERRSPDGAEQSLGGRIELQRSGALIERAMAVLAAGPTSTAELAERVFGMRGNARAAASAVWTLLASDPRFAATGEGLWSLRAAEPVVLPLLREEEWVVVDVETTGGTPSTGHRITEVAAVRVTGGQIRDIYTTLVNPGRPIPRMITALTGITNQMVSGAPRFREIMPRLVEHLEGRVFVAHNAPFDWRFVTAEMELAQGIIPSGRQLCTVRLARKLLPQLPSRSLGALAEYFGLEIAAHHRAEDDAVATAQLLLRLIDILENHGIEDWTGIEVLFGQRAARRKRRASPRSMDTA